MSATLFGVEESGASLLFVDEAAARLRPVRRMPTHAGHAAGTREPTAAAALSAEACPERVDRKCKKMNVLSRFRVHQAWN